MQELFGLGGKRVVVIGGGQGIGEATCLTLCRAGCDIAIVDIDPHRAERVAVQVREVGHRAEVIARDALDVSQSRVIIEESVAGLGGVDILVTVVGQAAIVRTLDVTPDIWDHDHSRNLRYVFFIAQAFARELIAREAPGSAVFIASASGIQASPRHAAYGAAKAGLMQLVRTLAAEWAQYGIRVNAVAPGAIMTPRKNEPWRSQELKDSPVPMRRMGEAKEVADAVLYLASDQSSYVTGQTTVVDGGWTSASLLRPARVEQADSTGARER